MKNSKRVEVEDRPSEPVASAESFGTWLRRQREGRDIGLREISEQSKISIRYLQALETGRFDVLPAAVFAKGFLRQYARYVGLDAEEVVNAYIAAREASEEEEEDVSSTSVRIGTSGSRAGTRALGAVLALLVLLIVLALVYFADQWRRAADEGASTPDSTPASASSTAARDLESAAGGSASGADAPSGASAEASDSPSMASDDDPTAGGSGASAPLATSPSSAIPSASMSASTTPASTTPAAEAPTAPLLVNIDFGGECWVEARVDGNRALQETRVQGETLQLEAEREVELTFGDGSVVSIEVNGRPFAFESEPGRVVRGLVIDLASVGDAEPSPVS